MTKEKITFDELLAAPSYLINLERRKERLEFALKNLKNAGFKNVIVLKAIDGTLVDIEAELRNYGYINIRKEHNNERKRNGQLASLLSHNLAIEKVKNSNSRIINIFEDDIEFHDQWFELAPKFLNETPSDWDLLFMGAQFDFEYLLKGGLVEFLRKNKIARKLSKILYPNPSIKAGDILKIPVFCNHAYTVKSNSGEKLINWMKSQKIGAYTIDCMLIDGMKGEPIVHDYNFIHYAWHLYRFPSNSTLERIRNDKKNSGLVFQNDFFESDLEVK